MSKNITKEQENKFREFMDKIEHLRSDVDFSLDNNFKAEWKKSAQELRETKTSFLNWFNRQMI